jgi:serine/threonine-protein kinase
LTQGPDREPVIKVLDFGISKMLDGTTSGSITETQRAVGSPSYMAPEQMRSAKRVDARADIWSMGIVLYEFLSGRPPFVADTIPELYALILDKTSRPTPLRELRAEIPEELERVVERCLEKDVGARYGDVGELAMALAPFGGVLGPISAARTRRILEAAAAAGTIVARAEPSERGENPARSTPTLGSRSPSEMPATVRQGRPPGAPISRPDADASASPDPSSLTATSFAETQHPPRRPRTLLAASVVISAVAALLLAFLLLKAPPGAPATADHTAPAALVPARAPVDPAPAITAAIAPPPVETPSAAPSSSTATRTPPAPPPRTARPKPGAPPDDVLLHRK